MRCAGLAREPHDELEAEQAHRPWALGVLSVPPHPWQRSLQEVGRARIGGPEFRVGAAGAALVFCGYELKRQRTIVSNARTLMLLAHTTTLLSWLLSQ